MLRMYGIKNCDTVKKARVWLEGRGLDHQFHDYKVAGIDRPRLERWVAAAGWEKLLNRAGTTFRKLDEADRADLDDRIIVLYAAAETLAATGAKDAQLKMSQANSLLASKRSGLTPRKGFQMFGVGHTPAPQKMRIGHYRSKWGND